MKKLKLKKSLVYLFTLVFPLTLISQDVGTINPVEGKSHSNEIFAVDNYFYIRNAQLQQQLFDFEGSYLSLETAVAQHPQSADALIQRAIFKKRFGMVSEAEADIRLASLINPYAADLHGYNGPASILNVIEFNPQEAIVGISSFKRIGYYYDFLDVQYQKKNVEIDQLKFVEQVIMQIEEEEYDVALNMINSTLDSYQNSFIAYDLKGLILMKQQKYDEAAKAFSNAIDLEPNFAIGWYNFSRLERARGNLELAEQYLDAAIHLEENLTKAYFDRAIVRKTLADKEGALEDYDKIIELKGDDYLEAFLNRGLTKSMLGDFHGALSDFNKAIEQYPDNASLYKNRANVYLLFGYPSKAIADYTKAIQLDPFFAEAYYNRGLTHLKSYDLRSGCRDLKKSQELGFDRASEKLRFFCLD